MGTWNSIYKRQLKPWFPRNLNKSWKNGTLARPATVPTSEVRVTVLTNSCYRRVKNQRHVDTPSGGLLPFSQPRGEPRCRPHQSSVESTPRWRRVTSLRHVAARSPNQLSVGLLFSSPTATWFYIIIWLVVSYFIVVVTCLCCVCVVNQSGDFYASVDKCGQVWTGESTLVELVSIFG